MGDCGSLRSRQIGTSDAIGSRRQRIPEGGGISEIAE